MFYRLEQRKEQTFLESHLLSPTNNSTKVWTINKNCPTLAPSSILLFYFFFFVRVCKAITPSLQLRFILCCIPRKLERDHYAKFWAYPLLHTNLFFVCCIYCAWLKWKACQILLISFCSSFSRALGNTLYSTVSPLIEKLCIEECCEIVQKVSLLHFRGNSLSRGHVFLRA